MGHSFGRHRDYMESKATRSDKKRKCGERQKDRVLLCHPSWSAVVQSRNLGSLQPLPPVFKPRDSRQRSHTGRQCDSFGQRGCFASAPVEALPGVEYTGARLVSSPQGKQQLEALRTETFTASTANPGRSGSEGKGRPTKEN
ncbi:hypothetical protein AAY473_029802 [Plecturocebus cupreus]